MSYSYQTPYITDKILNADAETQNRFDLIRKLSKGFTTEHPLAEEMDKLLMEQFELETEESEAVNNRNSNSNSQTASPRAKRKSGSSIPRSKTQSSDLTTIKEGLLNIFEELSEKSSHGSKGSQSNTSSTFTGKIGIEQLDEDLKKRLAAVTIIQYQIGKQSNTPKVAKSEIPAFQKIVDDVVLGQNVFLVGGAGTGKTTLAQNVAQALGREFMTINCSQWTAPTEILGGQTLDGYQEGKLIEAWKQGFILILDELPKIDPNTAGLLNDALAKSKISDSVIFNSRKEHFTKHPNFAVIATGNVWPNTESMAYGANNKQDLSLLDRFAGSVYFIEKNFELEQKVVGSMLLWTMCNELRNQIEELKYEAQISLRFMMTCRDTLLLEIDRIDTKGKTGVRADEGKTLADCFESFLSANFTTVQQKTIKDRFGTRSGSGNNNIAYSVIATKGYRLAGYLNVFTQEFTSSGYFKGGNGLSGLGFNQNGNQDRNTVLRAYIPEN